MLSFLAFACGLEVTVTKTWKAMWKQETALVDTYKEEAAKYERLWKEAQQHASGKPKKQEDMPWTSVSGNNYNYAIFDDLASFNYKPKPNGVETPQYVYQIKNGSGEWSLLKKEI